MALRFRLLQALVPVALAALTACSTIEAGAPVEGARRTGTFPNLNIPPRVSGPQMSNEDAAANNAALTARRNALRAEAAQPVASDVERLKQLAADRGQSVRKEIENP